MYNKLKFFDETFKVLLAVAASMWAVYGMTIFFSEGEESCAYDISSPFFTALAVAAGIMTALPLFYGLARLLLWPDGSKSRANWLGGWVISTGLAVFITAVIIFAVVVSQFGCR